MRLSDDYTFSVSVLSRISFLSLSLCRSLSLSLSALSFLSGIVKERRKIKVGAFPRKSFVSFRISSRSFAINLLGDDVGNNLA